MTSFADFGLPTPVVRELSRQGIDSPFPIQTATLPDSLKGRDVLGRGRTGSGKTLAFSLPTVARLSWAKSSRHPRRPRALVLCPTRELANQINATMEPVAKALGLVTTTIFGGVAQSRQVAALDKGADIVIACPGRLEDLLNQRLLTLDGIEITVLDEADHMADLGFLPGVKRIMDKTPKQGQRMLFSATLDNGVDQLVKRYLSNPVRHSVDDAAAAPPQMTHHILAVRDADAKSASAAPATKANANGQNRRDRPYPTRRTTAAAAETTGQASAKRSAPKPSASPATSARHSDIHFSSSDISAFPPFFRTPRFRCRNSRGYDSRTRKNQS